VFGAEPALETKSGHSVGHETKTDAGCTHCRGAVLPLDRGRPHKCYVYQSLDKAVKEGEKHDLVYTPVLAGRTRSILY